MTDIFSESGERSTLALDSRRILSGNYELGRVLGKGGFGITYAALDRSLQMPVAIKEYLPTSVAGRGTDRATVQPHGDKDASIFESGLNAFLKEGQTLARFNHPNIVRVLAFFRDNGTGYLVMPFLEGQTLAQYVTAAGGKITSQEAARIILPVLDGLRLVHAAGFLHRDIKPQNIYLTDEGGVILIDFGAARIAFGQESQSLSAVLTPGYAPFEQYYRKGNQGTWTDVYAAAATFYRAVTGQRPLESPERNEVDELKPANEIEPSISQALSDVLSQALAPKPEDRTQTVEAFHTELLRELSAAPGEVETQVVGTVSAATLPYAPPTPSTPFPPPKPFAAPSPSSPPPPAPTPTPPFGAETVLDASPPPAFARPSSAPDRDSGSSSSTPTARLVLTARRGCKILIDGEEVARLQKGEERTFMLAPGPHQITARADDGETRETTIDLTSGEERRVTIRLDGSSTRGSSVSGPHASTRKGFPKGLLIGGGAVLLLILAVAFWPRGGNDMPANLQSQQLVQPNVVAENQTEDNTPPPQRSAQGGVQTATIPFAVTGRLESADNTLQSGEYVDAYRFYGSAGDFVTAELSSQEFDTFLIVITPTGEQINVDDHEGDTSLTVIEDVLPVEGWYELMVTSFTVGETGAYFLELYY